MNENQRPDDIRKTLRVFLEVRGQNSTMHHRMDDVAETGNIHFLNSLWVVVPRLV